MDNKTMERQIQELQDDIKILASWVEDAVLTAATALKDNDLISARSVIKKDVTINSLRFEIESATIAVVATQQPEGHDLRVLTSILDLGTELERIGDYAKGIANIHLRSGGIGMPKVLKDLHYMANKAVDMLRRAMRAFALEDIETARSIVREDDLIDELYEQVYFEAIDLVVDDAANIERINYVLWVAHNIERVADRTTNVCERTIFTVTGELSELSMDEMESFTAEVQ
jgi:phosphate transport system protein